MGSGFSKRAEGWITDQSSWELVNREVERLNMVSASRDKTSVGVKEGGGESSGTKEVTVRETGVSMGGAFHSIGFSVLSRVDSGTKGSGEFGALGYCIVM